MRRRPDENTISVGPFFCTTIDYSQKAGTPPLCEIGTVNEVEHSPWEDPEAEAVLRSGRGLAMHLGYGYGIVIGVWRRRPRVHGRTLEVSIEEIKRWDNGSREVACSDA